MKSKHGYNKSNNFSSKDKHIDNIVSDKDSIKINNSWKVIQSRFRDKVPEGVLRKSNDTETAIKYINIVYKRMPFMFRLFVNKKKFVNFCLKNKDKLFIG